MSSREPQTPCSFEREPPAPPGWREFRGGRHVLQAKQFGCLAGMKRATPSLTPNQVRANAARSGNEQTLYHLAVRLAAEAGRGLKRPFSLSQVTGFIVRLAAEAGRGACPFGTSALHSRRVACKPQRAPGRLARIIAVHRFITDA